MDQRTLAPNLFRSRLIPGAAVFYTLAALLGIPGIFLLFDRSYGDLWVQDMMLGGITSGLTAWRLIHFAVVVFSFLCPLIMAAGLWLTIGKRTVPGMRLMSAMSQVLLFTVNVTGLMALIYMIFRVIRYIAICIPVNEGIYLIYATMLPEAVMILQAWFLWKKLREFFDSFYGTAASITYTLTSGKLDSQPIPSFTATGFLILSIFGFLLIADELFTLTIVQSYVQDHYKILIASHPGQYFAAATLLCGAVANILMSLFLRRYNRSHERAVYYFRKNKMA